MSCLTCETTPPPEKLSPEPVGPHHIGQRFGDVVTLGLVVLWRGTDVTAHCVEAHAGRPGDGWVEMRLVDNDGSPVIHPAASRICPDCRSERDPEHPDADGCPDCGSLAPTVRAWDAHAATVVRHGPVVILRGAEIVNGPPGDRPPPRPDIVDPNDQVRAMITKLYESHPQLRAAQEERENGTGLEIEDASPRRHQDANL